jgi:hypothetical protein
MCKTPVTFGGGIMIEKVLRLPGSAGGAKQSPASQRA